MPSITTTTIEPCSLEWMKTDFPIIFLWSGKIDCLMSTVDIPSPENTMSLSTKCVHIFCKFRIEYELILPCLFAFSPIWKVYAKYIDDILYIRLWIFSFFLLHLYMRNSSFICGWIFWEIREKLDIIEFKYSRMNPNASTSISRFFCTIVVSYVWNRCKKLIRELIYRCLDFLHEENIWVFCINNSKKFSFFMSCANAIYIPGNNFHKRMK